MNASSNYAYDLTVSVVAYRTDPEELKQAIGCCQYCAARVEVIVVDNSPTRDLEPACLSLGTRYIHTGKNAGFGSGHNIALKNASFSPYHVILNPDVQFGGGVLEELLAFMEKNDSVGLVMPRVRYPDGSPQNLCKKLPTPFDIVARRLFPAALQRIFRSRLDAFELRNFDMNQVLSVPYLSGCFMLLRKKTLEEIGGFDERFFMYFEDLDLTRRVHQRYDTVYYPSVSIVHRHEKGSYRNIRLLYCGIESAIRYFNKWGWVIDRERRLINKSIGPLVTLNALHLSKRAESRRRELQVGVARSHVAKLEQRDHGDGMTLTAKYPTLGSDIKISRMGLGCASAWGQAWFDEQDALEIVRRALELGVTVFDTGPSYSRGNAEPRLGKAIKGAEVNKLLISTKVGTHIAKNGKLFHDLSRESILEGVEASRRRLDLDTIPLLYLHGLRKIELNSQLEDTLAELQGRGWVRSLGVNSFDTDVLEALAEIGIFDVVMLDYNVLRPGREALITKLAHSGKLIVAGAAVANHLYAPGFLWPRSIADVWYSARAFKNYRKDLLRARKLAPLRACPGWTQAQVALAFVLSNDRVTTAMFGTTRLQHLEENIAACGLDVPDNIVERIRTL